MDSAKNININYTTISFALRIVFILMFACNLLSAKEYTGMVTPLIKSKINSGTDADFNGVIMHVARVGEIVKPEIVSF